MKGLYLYLIILVINVIVCLVSGFNLENRLPIWKYGPANSYFGYSIAAHIMDNEDNINSNSKWLVNISIYVFCSMYMHSGEFKFKNDQEHLQPKQHTRIFLKETPKKHVYLLS